MLFDSNILIRYLNGETVILTQMNSWRREGRAFIISSITTAEVLSLKSLSGEALEKVRIFLSTFVTVPFDDYLADVAAEFRRIYGLGLPDAAIAATALTLEVPLVTGDHQFKKVKNLTVIDV